MNDTSEKPDAGRSRAFAISPWWIRLDDSLTNRDRRVIDSVLSFAGGERNATCWPNDKTICKDCNVSPKAVSDARAWAEYRGLWTSFIAETDGPANTWRAGNRVYRIAWTPPAQLSATTAERTAFFVAKRPSRRAQWDKYQATKSDYRDFHDGNISTMKTRDGHGGNGQFSTMEKDAFPHMETQKNRPSGSDQSDQTRFNKPDTLVMATPPAATAAEGASYRKEILVRDGLAPPSGYLQVAYGFGLTKEQATECWEKFVIHPNFNGRRLSLTDLRKEWKFWAKRESKHPSVRYAGHRVEPNALLTEDLRKRAEGIGIEPDRVEACWFEFRCEMNSAPGNRGLTRNTTDSWQRFCIRKADFLQRADDARAEAFGV